MQAARPEPQLPLDFRPPGHRRGGKRAGAGRPKTGRRVGVVHATRPAHTARHPVHITLRVVASFPRLRRRDLWNCVRWAMTMALKRHDFRICQLSIQGNHIHAIVEADDRIALARGAQGFEISCARRMNRTLGRSGRVFADRYHARPLDTPTETRHALRYVLNNWRRHGEDRGTRVQFDPYSSGAAFAGWVDAPPVYDPKTHGPPLPIARPHTWLLRTGWTRAPGPPLSPHAVPSRR